MADLEAIAWTGGEENVGGINHTEVFAIDRDLLDTISAPAALDAATDLADAGSISTAHTPSTGKGFLKLEVIPKTGNVESTLAGEDDGKVYNNAFNFAIKTNNAKVLGLARWMKNRDMVFLVKEIGGNIRQIGSEEIPGRLSESTATLGGGGHDGRKQVSFTIADTQPYPAPVYDAAIPEPA